MDKNNYIAQCSRLIESGKDLIKEENKVNLTGFYKWQTLCQDLFISSVGAKSLFFLRFSQTVVLPNDYSIKSGIGILEAFKTSLELQESNNQNA